MCALAVLAMGVGAEQYYLQHRYRQVLPLPNAYRSARDVHHARIGIVELALQYPFDGKDVSNHVQYLATRHDGKSSPITTCRAWRQAVNDGRYRYVIAASPGFPFTTKKPALEAEWTRSDPAARLVLEDSFGRAHTWVFEITRALDPGGCPAPPGP